jgi:hypothetical protein
MWTGGWLLLAGCSSTAATPVEGLARSQAALNNGVTWTDEVGVSASGSSLTDTAATGWGNSGAASTQSLSGSGSTTFSAGETNTYRMAGLTHAVTDSSYDGIDFGIFLEAGGGLGVFEDGMFRGTFGTYAVGDVFTVQVTGSVVTYLQNGNLFYTSASTPTFPLVVDVALYTQGATLDNATLASSSGTSFWQNIVGVSVSDNSITKTAATGWGNAGASTVGSLSGSGNVVFTTNYYSGGDLMAGLTHTVTDSSYDDIDFALFVDAVGNVVVYEDGTSVGASASFESNETLSIQVTGSTVAYYVGSTLFYTSAKTPTFPLYFDAALYDTGAEVEDVALSSASTWQNVVGVTASGNDITKTGATGWGNAGASSGASLAGDGTVQFSTSEATTYKMAGLTHTVTDSSYDDIDFGFFLEDDGTLSIYEHGVSHGIVGTYAAGDTLTLQVQNSTVTYAQNGTAVYTSTETPTLPLVFDASLYSTGATVTGMTFDPGGSLFWQDQVGVTVSGNSITKTAATGWGNAGAYAATLVGPSNTATFTTAEATTYKMAGLTHAVTDSSYDDIDFGIFLESDATFAVYEDGVYRGTFGTYAAGDTFGVELGNGMTNAPVTYLHNGSAFYTSSNMALVNGIYFDVSLYSTGATINDVSL